MREMTRQPTVGATRPGFSLIVWGAATIAALVWPALAPDAGLFTTLGHAATAILWVPFALAGAAELLLLVAPSVGTLSAGGARRLATARLVSGLRLLARCAAWLMLVVVLRGAYLLAWRDRLTGSPVDLALALAGVVVFGVVTIPHAGEHLDRLNPTRDDLERRASSAGGKAATSDAVLDLAVPTNPDPLDGPASAALTAALLALRFVARLALVVIRAAGRWTCFGIAALDPRLGSDPLAALNAATATKTADRAANAAASAHASTAAAGARAALAGTGTLLGRVVAALRRAAAGDPDQPVIYGPASIWTEKPLVKGAPLLTKREPLQARAWRNDPAVAELVELGNAILEAAHADALQHGNTRGLRGSAMLPPEFEDRLDLPPAEVGKKLILVRAWARGDYFAFILRTAPVVSNDVLGRMTAANLAANVAAHSRFTRSQVLAWLHTEHDPNDMRAEVVADDPARAGAVGTFLVFDRGAARRPPVPVPPGPADADDRDDDEDDDSPFARGPF